MQSPSFFLFSFSFDYQLIAFYVCLQFVRLLRVFNISSFVIALDEEENLLFIFY